MGILVEPVIEEPGMVVTEIGDEFHGIEVEFATVIGAEDRADVLGVAESNCSCESPGKKALTMRYMREAV